MSGTTSHLGGHARVIPPIVSQPKKRAGCGCLGTVTGAILFAVIVIVFLLNPWALHMGGRWTPTLTWHGVGKLQSSSGATYGLYMEVSLYSRSRRRTGSLGGRKNLQGTAKICTPRGDIHPLTVDGYLKSAWLDVDGKPVTFYLSSTRDAEPKLRFDLVGSWQGQQLVLDDKGSMAMSFAPDGTAKGYLKGPNAPQENANVSLRYASESEFVTVCGNKAASSF